VTLEVDTAAAQKLGLAASVGALSLVLRKAGDSGAAKTARITLKDLLNEVVSDMPRGNTTTVVVSRGLQKQDYRVPLDGEGRVATAGSR
jgi:pilus assembly protein CpaB